MIILKSQKVNNNKKITKNQTFFPNFQKSENYKIYIM